MGEKDYVWNPTKSSCENGKYLSQLVFFKQRA